MLHVACVCMMDFVVGLYIVLIIFLLGMQTISYMAERVVGTGSFGVVFQVLGIISCILI